jgi:peptidoglycan/LPS O-acetylase OafA/YrhL
MNVTNKRNTNIEALRVIAIFLILLLHVSTTILKEDGILVTNTAVLFRSYTFLGVSIFAFISGYYGTKWNSKKLFKYEFMSVFWGG